MTAVACVASQYILSSIDSTWLLHYFLFSICCSSEFSYLCPKLLQQNEAGGNDIGQLNATFSKTDSTIDIRNNSAQSLMADENQEQNTDEDEHDSLTSQDMLSFSWQIAQGMVS